MAKSDTIQDKLTELGAKLEASKADGTSGSGKDADTAANAAPAPSKTVVDSKPPGTDAEKPEVPDLSAQFQELLDALNKDLKEVNPITLLLVFVLGLLAGRFLSR